MIGGSAGMRVLIPALYRARGNIVGQVVGRRFSVPCKTLLNLSQYQILGNTREMSQLVFNDKVAIVTGAGGGRD